MQTRIRIAAFAGALAVAAGGAALGGAAMDPVHDEETTSGHGHGEDAGHEGGHASAPAEAAGLAVEHGGLRLQVLEAPGRAGEAGALRFRILGADGRAVREFDPETGGIPLHLIVVRRDMTGFQHLHPRMAPDGTWSIRLRLPTGGSHRAFADVTVAGRPHTLGVDLAAAGEVRPRALPAPARVARTGRHAVRLDHGPLRAGVPADLSFSVTTASGAPAALEPYLGAGGHLVALREGDLGYLHVHPEEVAGGAGRVAFGATFPSAGRYRLFLQVQRGGRVLLAPFTVEVGR